MEEKSQLEAMRAAVRGDFERLERRRQEEATPPPRMQEPPSHAPSEVAVEPEPQAEPPHARRQGLPGRLTRLLGFRK